MAPRIVFMGSPDFALPILKALASAYPVVGVVTQPDRPAGRGRVLTAPPVKELALQFNIPLIQPNRLKEPAAWEQLQAWRPDLMVVAAFGQILRQNVLDLAPLGCINVHASLLPRWRGAAPIQAAILAGDPATGVTIMKMDAGVDTGAVLSQEATDIDPQDNSETLAERLSRVGASLLMKTLPGYLRGDVLPRPQDETKATRAVMVSKEDGLLDFNLPAATLERRVRAYYPWPGAYFEWAGGMLKVQQVHLAEGAPAIPGSLGVIDSQPAVATIQGWLVLDEVQPAGKKPMPGAVFLRGARQWGEAQ